MAQSSAHIIGLILLTVATIGWYMASLAASDALSGAAVSPGRRGIAQSLCVAIAAIIAIILNRPEIAIGIIFATSITSLTLVLGIITLSSSSTQPTSPRRPWGFVLPAGLIALMIGFKGGIGWLAAATLAIEGLVILELWREPPLPVPAASNVAPSAGAPGPVEAAVSRRPVIRWLQLLVAVAAAIVAGWAAVSAALAIGLQLGLPVSGTITAVMLAPALVLSLIGTGTKSSLEGHYDHAVSALVAFVMLNICAVLPMTAAMWITRPQWQPYVSIATSDSVAPDASQPAASAAAPDRAPANGAWMTDRALPYPMAAWRLDTVLLVAVGLLLLPVALGRWTLGQSEAVGLLATYGAYLALAAFTAR